MSGKIRTLYSEVFYVKLEMNMFQPLHLCIVTGHYIFYHYLYTHPYTSYSFLDGEINIRRFLQVNLAEVTCELWDTVGPGLVIGRF